MLFALVFSGLATAAAPPACKDGAIIDLNVDPVVSIVPTSEDAILTIEGGKTTKEDRVSLASPGFVTTGMTFSASEYLARNGLNRQALERGGFLRVIHGIFLESEGESSTECLLTFDAPPVQVRIAEEQLAAAKRRQQMQSVMECDPQGTRDHAIKAPQPAKAIRIPPGQGAQGDGVLTIFISTAKDFTTIGEQKIQVAGGKMVSSKTATPALFCEPRGLTDLCVNTEDVFTLTGNGPFNVSTEVDWFEMSLSSCTVSR